MEMTNIKTETVTVEKTVEKVRPEIIIFMGLAYRLPEGVSKGEYMKELRKSVM